MTIDHFRIGHGGAFAHSGQAFEFNKRALECTSQSFYKSPSMDQKVDALQPLTVSWDSSCLPDAKLVDIWVFAPETETPRLHVWQNVINADGTHNVNLQPKWWKSTPSILLQVGIVPAGERPMTAKFSGFPTITATYTQPAEGVPASADTSKPNSSADGYTDVSLASGAAKSASHLSSGKVAAAVIMPLLVAAVAIFLYLRWARSKGKQDRKRWSEALDKRMSTISTDWKSMSAAGASAAIRNSMAVDENGNKNRNSSFSFGAIRPSSSYNEGPKSSVYGGSQPQMSQTSVNTQASHIRPGFRQSAFENRTSRISFAADTRPSGESRRTRHIPSEYIPPVPSYRPGNSEATNSVYEEKDSYEVGSMSPRQTYGAPPLTPDDIRTRIGDIDQGRPSLDLLPALAMMRTDGRENDEGSFYTPPSPPRPTHIKTTTSPVADSTGLTSPDYFNGAPANPEQYVNAPAASTIFSSSPLSPGYPLPASPPSAANPASFGSFGGMMQPMPASVMSPDDMLRAYAARSAASTPSTAGMRTSLGNGSPDEMMKAYASRSSTPSGKRTSIGNGTGFGASVATIPAGSGNRRSLIPAGPGAISASRGAYGVAYDESEEWGQAH